MERETLKALVDLVSFNRMALTVLVILTAWAVIRTFEWLFDWLAQRFQRSRVHISHLFPVIRLAIRLVAVGIIVFWIFSPSQNVALALAASVGLAFGLALEGVIRNAVAGTIILFHRPFSVGDMIQMAGHYGEVVDVKLNSTRIKTFDDNIVAVPNGIVLKEAVLNASSGGVTEMVVVEFSVPATLDTGDLRELCTEAAACSPYAYLKQPITVALEDRFDRTFLTTLKVKVYVLDVRFERLLYTDVVQRIKRELVNRGMLTDAIVLGILHSEQV